MRNLLINKINNFEEILDMGLFSESEAGQQVRELYCQILDKHYEGSHYFNRLTNELKEVQSLAFDIYEIEE